MGARNPENTVFDAKRLIGRKFSDTVVQADIKLWPFKVISGAAEKPMIQVHFNGKTNQITITNEKGRLSQSEIDRMVQEAEKYRAEDEQNKQKIEAKNGLENYCFQMRNTLSDDKLKDKFEGGDKEKIESAVQEALDWLDKNQLAEKDEFEAKQKEIEGIVNPIMMKVYQAAGGAGMPEGGMPGGGMPGGGGNAGPTVEEVD